MNGQSNIEFLISTLVFLMIISFSVLSVTENYPTFHRESMKNYLISKSFQLSELLLWDTGYPKNWNLSNVKMVGLSVGSPYILDKEKISYLNCTNYTDYQRLKSILKLPPNLDFIINITNGSNTLSSCAPEFISTTRPKYTITRFAVINGTNEIVEISITVY